MDAKEIKLNFKTSIDSVEYPVVETEQEIKMKQLQETIDKAARELKELREMGEKTKKELEKEATPAK